MTMKQSMKAISFAAMLGIAALSAQVAVGQSDSGLGPLTS
jgi:hypothetical protein